MKRLTFRLAVLTAVVIFIQNPICINNADGFVFWTDPNGSADNFYWANGGSDFGLFGDPTLVGGDTLLFSPSGFIAKSLDGESNFITDKLVFELIAYSGFRFQSISITEYGDYQISGNGSVNVSGNLSVENLDAAGSLNNDLVAVPSMPVTGDNYDVYGLWSASAQVDINQPDWTYIKITLQNDLLAITTENGSIAWIEKKTLGTAIAIRIIPEPATIAILLIGSLAFIPKKKNDNYKIYL
ncbi:MAG: hypothetical protein WC496_00825 [Phycisphaerae bacterium]|jgi:hypothetical protein